MSERNVRYQRLNNQATIFVDGEIDGYWINEEYFRWMLNDVDPNEDIEVRINSEGGDPMTALQIYAMLKRHQGKVTAYIEFMCASAATIIACAADKVIIANIAWEMVHRVGGGGNFDNADEADNWAKVMRTTEDQLLAIYQKKTGRSEDELRAMINAETWMSAQDAVDNGFADEVDEVIPMLSNSAGKFKLAAKFTNVPKELTNTGQSQADSTNQPTQSITMSVLNKLKNMIGLSNDADDTDVAIATRDLKAKADQHDAVVAERDDLQSQLAEANAKIAELEKSQSTAEQEAEEAEEQELEETLENAVKEYKIKASAKEGFKEQFKGNVEGLKNMLDGIEGGKPGQTPRSPKTKNTASGTRKVHDAVGKYFSN